MTNWGPWIRYEGSGRPEGLQDDQMIKAAFINGFGDIIVGGDPREVGYHLWPNTLAYCVELVETTHVLYGISGSEFTTELERGDEYQITYTVNQDGDVLSCKMEKLK